MNFYFWFSVTQMYFSLVIKLKIFFKKKKKSLSLSFFHVVFWESQKKKKKTWKSQLLNNYLLY